jgi:hypothetical protein
MGWIAERHLASVAEEAEAGHIGDGMDWLWRRRRQRAIRRMRDLFSGLSL